MKYHPLSGMLKKKAPKAVEEMGPDDSLSSEVMSERKMAKGGMVGSEDGPVDAPTDADMDMDSEEKDAPMEDGRESRGMDLEDAPMEEDSAHEQSDASLVSDILKDRKARRRG